MKCKHNCAPGGTLSKTRLASCSGDTGGIHWRMLRAAPARYWPDTLQDSPAKKLSRLLSGDPTGELLWDTQRDTRRIWRAALVGKPLASYSGGILDPLASYSETRRNQLRMAGRWWATRRDPLASALAGYLAGSTGEPLWRDTRREALAGYSAGSTGERDTRRDSRRDTRWDPLASCSSGIPGGGVV